MSGMDYVLCGSRRWLPVVVLVAMVVSGASAWYRALRSNYVSLCPLYLTTNYVFDAPYWNEDNFKILRVEGNAVFIGSKNRLYYLQFGQSLNVSVLEWPANNTARTNCLDRGKVECDNYIRVVVPHDSKRTYYICGTYAYDPKCRYYSLDSSGVFHNITDNKDGTCISPFNPNHNSTAIYTEGKLFTATECDVNERHPVIMQMYNNTAVMRTQTQYSYNLNEPQFVSSDQKNDKVFFFFREVAVENINCEKAIHSRVARVCKNDHPVAGLPNIFTSYFKARLNCSIPGEYPFYFDKIESATEFGQGNHRRSSNRDDRTDMVYGVFNTPDHAISGSAVCAFRHSDIEKVFNGAFKYQESHLHNWLPLRWDVTRGPHPAQCANQGDQVSHDSRRFAQSHMLMNEAVPAAGGMPLLVRAGSWSKFTQIAVDWQVRAADGNYYDVMFVGTDAGHIIKAINVGTEKVESVVIERIQVLEYGDPVVSLKVLSQSTGNGSLLVVASRSKVVSIPVHRCQRETTCRECVALQDPYCVWNQSTLKCINAQTGIQNIISAVDPQCEVSSRYLSMSRNLLE